jgi:hypothetical protein
MQAQSLKQLYEFEPYIISASRAVLNSEGITAFAQQDSRSFTTPDVSLQSIIGTPGRHVKLSGSKAYPDEFNVQLGVLVTTARNRNASTHYQYTSKVVAALSDPTNYNSGSNLPYHTVRAATYNGSTPRIEPSNNFDLTELNFALSVWIKPPAWP